ncbi:hypothetical protein U1Q18_022355, partial [Sarracenia purpurea var. burkii]
RKEPLMERVGAISEARRGDAVRYVLGGQSIEHGGGSTKSDGARIVAGGAESELGRVRFDSGGFGCELGRIPSKGIAKVDISGRRDVQSKVRRSFIELGNTTILWTTYQTKSTVSGLVEFSNNVDMYWRQSSQIREYGNLISGMDLLNFIL